MKTIAGLRTKQASEEAAFVRAALVAEEWMIARAAKRLKCPATTLRRIVDKHEKLSAEYAKRSPGRGRPPNT